MPTVMIVKGYRFAFFSADIGEPPHLHVTKGGSECKVWLGLLQIARNRGFREHELSEIADLIRQHHGQIMQAWYERSGNPDR
jgi:hypothetical protein